MPNSRKIEEALREFIVETIAEELGSRGRNQTPSRGISRRGRVTDPEKDMRIKRNR